MSDSQPIENINLSCRETSIDVNASPIQSPTSAMSSSAPNSATHNSSAPNSATRNSSARNSSARNSSKFNFDLHLNNKIMKSIIEYCIKAKTLFKTHVWEPLCRFSINLWNRILCSQQDKKEPEVEMQTTDEIKHVSTENVDTTLVHRNMSNSDEKIQSAEKELNEISIMRISRSASISSLIRDDYVGSNNKETESN